MKKAFLILLVIACVATAIWTAYLLFTNQIESIVGGIILAVDIGVLVWNISVLRAYRIKAGTIVAVFLIVALIAMTVSAFAGVEPFAGIKASVISKINDIFVGSEDAAARKVVCATIDAFNRGRGDRLAGLTTKDIYKLLVSSHNHPMYLFEEIIDYKLTTLQSDQTRSAIRVRGGAREKLMGSVRPYDYVYTVAVTDGHWVVTKIASHGD